MTVTVTVTVNRDRMGLPKLSCYTDMISIYVTITPHSTPRGATKTWICLTEARSDSVTAITTVCNGNTAQACDGNIALQRVRSEGNDHQDIHIRTSNGSIARTLVCSVLTAMVKPP